LRAYFTEFNTRRHYWRKYLTDLSADVSRFEGGEIEDIEVYSCDETSRGGRGVENRYPVAIFSDISSMESQQPGRGPPMTCMTFLRSDGTVIMNGWLLTWKGLKKMESVIGREFVEVLGMPDGYVFGPKDIKPETFDGIVDEYNNKIEFRFAGYNSQQTTCILFGTSGWATSSIVKVMCMAFLNRIGGQKRK
jgi:hypothetical protein